MFDFIWKKFNIGENKNIFSKDLGLKIAYILFFYNTDQV